MCAVIVCSRTNDVIPGVCARYQLIHTVPSSVQIIVHLIGGTIIEGIVVICISREYLENRSEMALLDRKGGLPYGEIIVGLVLDQRIIPAVAYKNSLYSKVKTFEENPLRWM